MQTLACPITPTNGISFSTLFDLIKFSCHDDNAITNQKTFLTRLFLTATKPAFDKCLLELQEFRYNNDTTFLILG